MYEFYNEGMKYRVIDYGDHKHFILVGHTLEEVKNFCEAHQLTVPTEPEKDYIVHDSTNQTLFMFAITSLIRRLAPLQPYGILFPYFKRTKDLKLIAKGVYVGEGECPFHVINPAVELLPVEMPHG